MSMTPHRYDFTVWKGSTLYIPFAIEAPDGTTYNLATVGGGYTVGRLTVRDTYGGTALLELTTGNGGVVVSAFTDASGTWSGYWFASAAATAALTDWGDGVYDMEISDGSNVEKSFFGTVTLSPETTT